MSVNGLSEVNEQNLRSIRKALAESGILVSADPASPRNARLQQLILSKTRYAISDAAMELAALDDEEAEDLEPQQEQEPPPLADTAAVIIWAGTQLTSFQIARLQDVYARLGIPVRHGLTDALAQALCNQVTLDNEPAVNQQFKNFMGGADAVQQALDQELIHAEVIGTCEAMLSRIAAQVTVYRPADALFIRFELQHLPGHWRIYGPADDQQLISQALDASKKTILLTIGHGDPYGRTNFPSRGLKSQPEIAGLLGPVSISPTTYRIPLQCYPQKAVTTWEGKGGAASIPNDGPSHDNEMKAWIRDHLENTLRQWLAKF